MRLTASDFYTYWRPSECGLRVHYRHRGVPEGEPGPYEEVIRRLGGRHEQAHLETLGPYVDLRGGSLAERARRTVEEVGKRTPVIYQGVFCASAEIGGQEVEVVGEPDFLIRGDDGYVVRDAKISRRITEGDHPEILRQLELYGWLYERVLGAPPKTLQVFSGGGELVQVPSEGAGGAIEALGEILRLKRTDAEPYSPVGWTKCGGCIYHEHCWTRARENRDVALIVGVDQGLASALREEGIETIDQLLDGFDEARLGGFRRSWGPRMQRVGRKAGPILQMARAMATGEEILLEPPALPESPNYVMFDLEGLPPQLDELDTVYLWGVQVFGENPGPFQAGLAGFGPGGDEEGWRDFLGKAGEMLDQHGDVPFVHRHHYERVRLDAYIDRYGDPDGTAARVRENLLDLLPITQRSVALPLPSYSLKVVEKHIGFERTLDEYGGDWAMAKYIEATEMEDEQERSKVMGEILRYNREDLEATWGVFGWLRGRVG